MRNEKGQNIVEHILLVVAVILVFLVIANPKSGPIKKSVEATLNSSTNQIDQITQDIKFK